MVLPVTGPFRITTDSITYYKDQQVWKQARPFDRPLNYSMTCCRLLVNDRDNEIAHSVKLDATTVEGFAATNYARMQAYERLKDAIGSRASMGENFVDLDQSIRTITSRSLQLFRFTREIKRGNFREAASILRSPELRKHHPVKEAANNWLEYHLGIEPVVQDIYTALNIIQSPIKNIFCKASSKAPIAAFGYDSGAPYTRAFRYSGGQVVVKYQAEVAVSNPVLYLANAMGIINPVQVVWQVIPLSFVADWFANVEQFFGTSTDFWGLTVQKPYTTLYWVSNFDSWWHSYPWKSKAVVYGLTRTLGLTLPNLSFRPYKATSWQRGLTAISLLVGGLKSLDTTNYRPETRKLRFKSFDKNFRNRVSSDPGWDWMSKYL